MPLAPSFGQMRGEVRPGPDLKRARGAGRIVGPRGQRDCRALLRHSVVPSGRRAVRASRGTAAFSKAQPCPPTDERVDRLLVLVATRMTPTGESGRRKSCRCWRIVASTPLYGGLRAVLDEIVWYGSGWTRKRYQASSGVAKPQPCTPAPATSPVKSVTSCDSWPRAGRRAAGCPRSARALGNQARKFDGEASAQRRVSGAPLRLMSCPVVVGVGAERRVRGVRGAVGALIASAPAERRGDDADVDVVDGPELEAARRARAAGRDADDVARLASTQLGLMRRSSSDWMEAWR